MNRFWLFLALIGLHGCDSLFPGGTNDGELPATEILDFSVTPSPAAPGDTVLIRCTVKDSIASDLRYDWIFQNTPNPPNSTSFLNTATCATEWKAPQMPGDYRHMLNIKRTGFSYIQYPFMITIIENESQATR